MKTILLFSIITLASLTSSNLSAAGDAAAGKASYMICAACHGVKGEGNRGMQSHAWLVKTLGISLHL